jgi:hypothetical protein
MWWRRRPRSQLDEVVGLLQSLGTMLMSIDARLEEIANLLRDETDES